MRVSKKAVRKNVVFMKVVDQCKDRLEHRGGFAKKEILDSLEMVGLSMPWDVIKELIEEDLGEDLYPMASACFGRRLKNDSPSKYQANGPGKITAGWVKMCPQHAKDIEKFLRDNGGRAVGAITGYNKRLVHARDSAFELDKSLQPLAVTRIAPNTTAQ